MGSRRDGLLAQPEELGILERPFTPPNGLVLDGEPRLDAEELRLAGLEVGLAGRELRLQLRDSSTALVCRALARLPELALALDKLSLSAVELERTLVDCLEPGGVPEVTLVFGLAFLGLDRTRTLLELERPRLEPVALRVQLLFGRFDGCGSPNELIGRTRERGLLLLPSQVLLGELLCASRMRRLCLGDLLLARGEARLLLLELELAFPSRGLPLTDGTLPLGGCCKPLAVLAFLLGPRKRSASSKGPASLELRVELASAALDLELAPSHFRRPLPERSFQLLELGQILVSLPLALLCQMACKSQELRAVGWTVRPSAVGVQLARLPGLAAPAHAQSVA